MGLIAPPVYIAPPGIDRGRYGLLSVATEVEGPDRWEAGLEWEPLRATAADLRPHTCVDLDYATEVDLVPGVDHREAIPFVVVGSYRCLSASRPLAEAEQRARLHLSAGEERAVELAVTTGIMGNTPSLQGAVDLTPTPGTAVPLLDGVGLLEAHLAAHHHSAGVLHTPRILAARMAADAVVDRRGERLETLVGTYVASGAALAQVGPTGTPPAAGTAWLYGTGRPTFRRSEVFVQPDDTHYLERDTNEVAIMAQRAYLVTWEGPTVAVLVTAPGA
jgi:hypothetical protein